MNSNLHVEGDGLREEGEGSIILGKEGLSSLHGAKQVGKGWGGKVEGHGVNPRGGGGDQVTTIPVEGEGHKGGGRRGGRGGGEGLGLRKNVLKLVAWCEG